MDREYKLGAAISDQTSLATKATKASKESEDLKSDQASHAARKLKEHNQPSHLQAVKQTNRLHQGYDKAPPLSSRQGSHSDPATLPSQKHFSQPTIPTEKVCFEKRYDNEIEEKERVVLATNARPENRRNFDHCFEKQKPIHDWVKNDGFGSVVEHLEYRVYIDEIEAENKLKAQTDAAEAQQKRQSSKGFAKSANEDYNSRFTSLDNKSGVVILDEAVMPSKDHPAHMFHKSGKSAVQLEYVTENPQTGVARSIGRRESMDDNHIAENFEINIAGIKYPVQLTGVLDGHGGPEFSTYVKDNIVNLLKEYLEIYNSKGLSKAGIMSAMNILMVDLDGRLGTTTPCKIAVEGALDRAGNQKFRNPGTTANVAIMLDGELWVANVGDSRALLVDDKGKTRQISSDIKPADVSKKAQVRGGFAFPGTGVTGFLYTGTAIGNHHSSSVSSRPKLTHYTAEEFRGKMLFQVCDGITDKASSNEIGQVAAEYFKEKEGNSPAKVAGKLVAQAYAAGSYDNLTCMITLLNTLVTG